MVKGQPNLQALMALSLQVPGSDLRNCTFDNIPSESYSQAAIAMSFPQSISHRCPQISVLELHTGLFGLQFKSENDGQRKINQHALEVYASAITHTTSITHLTINFSHASLFAQSLR